MANARQAALAERRNPELKRRILAPVSTGISSIAKQNAANETDIMIAKYNSGSIGNAEMKTFLETQMNNQYVSAADKLMIQKQLADFDVLIQKDRLEATFKLAPENSIQKAQAATALADFYKQRASTMEPGTPAQSQALENAGSWQNTVVQIQDSVNKEQQKNYKYQLLAEVNALPNGVDRASKTAEMYGKLYNLALSQGDQESAQTYYANIQQAMTNVNAEMERAGLISAKEERKKNVDMMNQAKNDYHDGVIDANQFYNIMNVVNDYAVNNSDVTLQNSVNTAVDFVAKKEASGGLNRTTINGLPVVLKGSGSGTGTKTDWDDADEKLDRTIQLAQRFLKEGQTPDGKSFTTQDYKEVISDAISAKGYLTEQRIASLEEIYKNDPNAKITFDGKKNVRVSDVLSKLDEELNILRPQVDAINSGTFVIMEVAPSQFTKEGDFKKSGKSVPTYEIIDINNIPDELKGVIVPDDEGIYHQAYRKPIIITKEQFDEENPSGKDPAYGYNKNTNQYYKYGDALSVDLYQQGKSKIGQTVDVSPDKPLMSLESIQASAEQAWEDTKKKQEADRIASITKPLDATMVAPKKPLLQQAQEIVKPAIDAVTKQATEQIQNPLNVLTGATGQAVEAVKKNVVAPIQNKVQQTINPQPQQTQVPNQPGLTSSTPIKPIEFKPTPVSIPPPTQKDSGLSYSYTPPKAAPAPKKEPSTLQKIATTITSSSPFSWLKGKLGW